MAKASTELQWQSALEYRAPVVTSDFALPTISMVLEFRPGEGAEPWSVAPRSPEDTTHAVHLECQP